MARRDYQQGEMLHERFVLERPLRGGAGVQLWTAQDGSLGAPILLRIYAGGTGSDPATIDTVRRVARESRATRHPRVVRIHDVYVREGEVLVSLDTHAGSLLESRIEDASPLPYRRMVERMRPVIEALLEMHERGGEHGQLDEGHLLVDAAEHLTLLPAEGTRPARSDLHQLGRLFATLLTGGNPPAGAADLNDLADRLHEGRTVPALLNQLVNDLARVDPEGRPAGMRDVLHRLDQLELVVASAPGAPAAARPVRTVPIRVAAAAGTGRSRLPGAKIAWIVAGVVALGAAGVLVAGLLRPGAEPEGNAAAPPLAPDASVREAAEAPPGPEAADAGVDAAAPATPEADPAAMLAAKRDAEDALGAWLEVRNRADTIGAGAWGHASHALGTSAAADADRHFVAGSYEAAATAYRAAAAAFGTVLAAALEVLPRLLAEGQAALDAPDAERASARFEAALLIEPGHKAARIGLERAGTIDELHRMMAAGHAHENEGRLAFAFAEYTAAADLDPHATAAADAVRRVRLRLADEEFTAMMSAGLDAFHRGELDEARRRLLEARELRPGAPGVTEALAMVDEARLRAEVVRLRGEAEQHEANEQWQAARHLYRQVLAIDPAIAFAQDGVTRCEETIRLVGQTRHYLADPGLLVARGTREQAVLLVAELEAFTRRGPGLDRLYRELAEQVRQANTPRRVVLRSDEMTRVDVYRVARYGTLRSLEVELLPGRYTVVGSRQGFRDVRHVLDVAPTDEVVTLEVICREPI